MAGTRIPFGLDFQQDLLALCAQDTTFLAVAAETIRPEMMASKPLAAIFNTLRSFMTLYGDRPNRAALVEEVSRLVAERKLQEEELGACANLIAHCDTPLSEASVKYIKDKFTAFLREQAVRLETLAIPQLLQEGRLSEIPERLAAAASIGQATISSGTRWGDEEGLHERIYSTSLRQQNGEHHRCMPTGIFQVDRVLRNELGELGLAPSELGLFMGPPGAGKSAALIQAGRRALLEGGRVLHFTCEMTERQTAKRYDQAVFGATRGEVAEDPASVMHKAARPMRLFKGMGGELIIKAYPMDTATVLDLRADTIRAKKELGGLDLLLVDYADVVRPPRPNPSHPHLDDRAVIVGLSNMMKEFDMPGWSAVQVNREGSEKRRPGMRNIAGGFDRIKVAHVVIALCMEEAERERNLMRLRFLKNREGLLPTKDIVIHTDFAHGRLCDPVPLPEMFA